MPYPLAFHPQVKNHLNAIPENWRSLLEGALITLAQNPVNHSSPLKGKWSNLMVYQAPPYQLIYRLYDREQIIVITAISTIK